MKRKMMSCLLSAVFIITALLFTGHEVYAGDINGNEASVIAVASGTFTYNGKVYKAYDSYVNQLYSYMVQDSVDLSADQAARAINYIYQNVQLGVNSGYVYEVTEVEENNVDVEEAIEEMEEQEEAQADEKYEKAKDQAQEASDKEVDEMFQKVEEEHEHISSKPTATESDASVVIQKDEIVVTNKDKEWSVKRSERIVPLSITYTLIAISAAILVIDVVIAMVLIFNKCMRFGGNHGHHKIQRGHRKRRKIRKVCRRILTATTAVGLTILFLILGISVGVFSNNHLSGSIQSSGYFRYAYTQYLKSIVEENTTKDTDNKETDSTETTDQNTTDQDKTSEKNSQKESTEEPSTENLGSIDIMTYDEFQDQEKQAISNMQESELTEQISIVPYIRQLREDIQLPFIISSIIIAVAYIISAVTNIFMDMKRDRGVKSMAISDIIATIVLVIVVFVIWIWYTHSKLFIEPDYLFHFIGDFIEWLVKILITICFFGAAIGMALVGFHSSMRKDR